jgi:hypothetical protein
MKNLIIKKEYVYLRENLFQSVVADLVTFGVLFGGLLLNKFVLSNRVYIDVFFIILFLIQAGSRVSNKPRVFNDLKEFKEYVKNIK